MKNIIERTHDLSVQLFELAWIENIKKDEYIYNRYQNPSLTIYTSMLYGFANHLPYSMDIKQPEYVPADFLNMTPHDVEANEWFKIKERRNLFNTLVGWANTYKTGMLLQVCTIFQKMLLDQFPTDFKLKESDYEGWGIKTLTRSEEGNRCLFEIIKTLPKHYNDITSCKDNESRRNALNNMYKEVMAKIVAMDAGVKEENKIYPTEDIDKIVFWERIRYYDGIDTLIQSIKDRQLSSYNSKKKQGDANYKKKTTTKKKI